MDKSIFNQIKTFARGRCLPLIPIKAKDVTIIGDPDSFFKLILSKTRTCKRRLALSALYLGTGPKEKAIVQEICQSLASREGELSVNLVLDAHRATRIGADGVSSVTALEKLLPLSDVRLSLVETRSYNSPIDRFLRKYQKWNELSSTYHTKFLVFDNDVLITGANLSDIYFENRQDRYMLIKNTKLLSDYVSNLLDVFDRSLTTTTTNEVVSQTKSSMVTHLRRLNEEFSASMMASDDPTTLNDDDTVDSYVIPLVQLGSLGLQDKEDFLVFLNSILPPEAQVHLSSGYFNPSGVMNKIKINSVLAPDEESNGFYEGNGLLKYVPSLYTLLHRRYLDEHQDCRLFYYTRPGWSFHAKGMWVTGVEDLYIHLIGSSNFNHRSSRRDLETELVLLTRNKDLSQSLEMERVRLWKESTPNQGVAHETFTNPIYRLIARAVQSFL